MPIEQDAPQDQRRKRAGRLSPRAIAVSQKRGQAMEYRLQGWTFFDIGKALGVTPGRAHQLVDEALEATLQEPAAHLRALALARLEAVMTGVFGKAVNGDTKAVTIVLKIIDRHAKLLGLYEAGRTARGRLVACLVRQEPRWTIIDAIR